MSVEKVIDPISGVEMSLVKGEVEAIYPNEIKQEDVKTYSGGWTPTHKPVIQVNGTRIGLGMRDKAELNCKDQSGQYHQLIVGMKVTAIVEENGKYLNSKVSKITVTDATAKPQQKQQQNNSGGYQNKKGGSFKKDDSGMNTGHAINGAMYILDNDVKKGDVVEIGYAVHKATEEVKALYKKEKPELNDYALGASVGNAVLQACKLLSVDQLDLLVKSSIKYLKEYSEPLLERIKQESGSKETPKKEDPVDKEEPIKQESPKEESQEDFDDSLPF